MRQNSSLPLQYLLPWLYRKWESGTHHCVLLLLILLLFFDPDILCIIANSHICLL